MVVSLVFIQFAGLGLLLCFKLQHPMQTYTFLFSTTIHTHLPVAYIFEMDFGQLMLRPEARVFRSAGRRHWEQEQTRDSLGTRAQSQ